MILTKNKQLQNSIQDNHKGLPVAVNYNQTDHSTNDLSCVIEKFFLQQQTESFFNINVFLIVNCVLFPSICFLSSYSIFHMTFQIFTSL